MLLRRCTRQFVGKQATARSFSGIFVPVPTPFYNDDRQSVDFVKFGENVAKWEEIPFAGYCVGGTNGEGPFLRKEERVQLVKYLKGKTASQKFIIAGTTCESTEETCEVSEEAAKAGADAVLIMTPNYFCAKMTEENIEKHFNEVADRCSVPVLIYNMPSATGIDISLRSIRKLSKHPNIRGIKDSDIGKLTCIVETTKGEDFAVLAGSAGYLLPALLTGCSGGINGLAAICGQRLCQMFNLARKGDWNEALKLQKSLAVLDFKLLRELGPPGLKMAMEFVGYHGGLCRKPLHKPLPEETKNEIRQLLHQFGY